MLKSIRIFFKPCGLFVFVAHCFQLLFAFMLCNFFASFLFQVTHDTIPCFLIYSE